MRPEAIRRTAAGAIAPPRLTGPPVSAWIPLASARNGGILNRPRAASLKACACAFVFIQDPHHPYALSEGILIGGIVDIVATSVVTFSIMIVAAARANVASLPKPEQTKVIGAVMQTSPIRASRAGAEAQR